MSFNNSYHPNLQQSLRDCLQLCQDQQQELASRNPHLIPLPLLRLEFRLLYLLCSYCRTNSQRSNQESSRYLELNRLLNPRPEQLPSLPPNPSPFDNLS